VRSPVRELAVVRSPAEALFVTTRPLAAPVDLLSWLPAPRRALSWVREGDGLVGWGIAATFTARGPGRFARALRWWQELTGRVCIADEVGAPGTGPVAFASMAFADEPAQSVLILPRVLVGRREGLSWVTTIGGAAAPSVQPLTAPCRVRYQIGSIGDAAHRRSVATAIARIRAGELAKVVLARDLIAAAAAPLDERYLCAAWLRNTPPAGCTPSAALLAPPPNC
jgi:menaquinone-specific isochorismate synthase